MHGCFNLVSHLCHLFQFLLLLLMLLHVSTFGFVCRTSLVVFFCGNFVDNTPVVDLPQPSCIAVSFSATKTHQRQTETFVFPAHPWQSQTGPDPLCLDAIELIQAFLPNKYDQSCRSFLDGVGPCRRPFGNRRGCHGLSFDLSSVLSSTCHSRDLILEIHP